MLRDTGASGSAFSATLPEEITKDKGVGDNNGDTKGDRQ